jgi:hypothetical protein
MLLPWFDTAPHLLDFGEATSTNGPGPSGLTPVAAAWLFQLCIVEAQIALAQAYGYHVKRTFKGA